MNYIKIPKDYFLKMFQNDNLVGKPLIKRFDSINFIKIGIVKDTDDDNLYCEIYDPPCLNGYDCKTCEFVFENM